MNLGRELSYRPGPSWHGPSFMWAELAWAELVLGRVVRNSFSPFWDNDPYPWNWEF